MSYETEEQTCRIQLQNRTLSDGDEVVFLAGINVASGQTLNIYGQSNDSGSMECTGDKGDAAIGGAEGQSGGNINVYGGTVKAKGGKTGAGIGGGDSGSGADVAIYGCRSVVVTAGYGYDKHVAVGRGEGGPFHERNL